MTFILVIAFLMIAFIGLLRYDIHKHKHGDAAKDQQATGDKDDKPKP